MQRFAKTNGDLGVQYNLSAERPYSHTVRLRSPDGLQVVSLAVRDRHLVALSSSGQLFARVGITKEKPDGQDWSPFVGYIEALLCNFIYSFLANGYCLYNTRKRRVLYSVYPYSQT